MKKDLFKSPTEMIVKELEEWIAFSEKEIMEWECFKNYLKKELKLRKV